MKTTFNPSQELLSGMVRHCMKRNVVDTVASKPIRRMGMSANRLTRAIDASVFPAPGDPAMKTDAGDSTADRSLCLSGVWQLTSYLNERSAVFILKSQFLLVSSYRRREIRPVPSSVPSCLSDV